MHLSEVGRLSLHWSTNLSRNIRQPPEQLFTHHVATLASVRCYEERIGGFEMPIKDSKQVLGLTKGNKKHLRGSADGGAVWYAGTFLIV